VRYLTEENLIVAWAELSTKLIGKMHVLSLLELKTQPMFCHVSLSLFIAKGAKVNLAFKIIRNFTRCWYNVKCCFPVYLQLAVISDAVKELSRLLATHLDIGCFIRPNNVFQFYHVYLQLT